MVESIHWKETNNAVRDPSLFILIPAFKLHTPVFLSFLTLIKNVLCWCLMFLQYSCHAHRTYVYLGTFADWPFSEVLVFTLVFIPLWILPSTFSGLAAGAFCIQFGVQGAWGLVRLISKLDKFADLWYNYSLDSHPTRGDVTSSIPSYVSRCRIPIRQRISTHSELQPRLKPVCLRPCYFLDCNPNLFP